jgi:predicted dehydrogenase
VSGFRAVLVGAGGMGRAWARAMAANPDVQLVGWVDLFTERVAEGIKVVGLSDVAIGQHIEGALLQDQPDFVVDAAVPEAHHGITRRCLEQGVAVLGEKPIAATFDEARDLVACAERTSTLFAVSQNRRYNARLAAFKGLICEHLGGIGQLNAEFYRAPHFGGFREEMDSPLLVDMAIHTFDAARYVTGADPVSVLCSEFNPRWSWYRGAASAVAEFEFTEGIRFSYQGSWCAQGLETSWDASWRAIGPVGSATWDGGGNPVAEVLRPGANGAGGEHIEAPPAKISGDGISGTLADFVKALRTGEKPMTECHDNIKSFAMVFAALESSRRGRRVDVGAQ